MYLNKCDGECQKSHPFHVSNYLIGAKTWSSRDCQVVVGPLVSQQFRMPQGDRNPMRIWLSGFGSDNMMPMTSKCDAAWHRGEQANFKRRCNCYTVLAAASPFLRDPIQLQGTLRSAAWLLARQIQTSSYSLCPKTKHGMNLSMVCASEQAHNKPIQMPVFYWKTWKNCGESLTRYLDVFGGIFCLMIHRTLCWTQAMQNTSKNVKKLQDCTPARRSGCNAETGWCVVHFPGPLCPSSPCRDLWPRNVIEFPDESTSLQVCSENLPAKSFQAL